MKKHLSAFLDKYRAAFFTVLILCFSFFGQAQQYQQYSQYGMKIKRIDPQFLLGIPNDTFPIPAEYQTKMHLAGKEDSLYKWSTVQLRWVPLNFGSGAACENALLTDWSVSWQGTGYNFSVHGGLSDGSGRYQIICDFFTADSITLTPDAADDDKERIDIFYVDATGVHIRKGDTAAVGAALKPTVNADEIELSFVTISPGTTVPSITQTIIYNENTESNVSNTGTTTDADNTTNVFIGAKSVNVTNINDPSGTGIDAVYFDKGMGSWNVLGKDGISFAIKLKAVMPTSGNIGVQIGNPGVGTEVIVPLVKSNITTFQQITIPFTSFGNITNTDITRVRFRYIRPGNNANYTGFYLDYIYFVDGIISPGPDGSAQFTINPMIGFNVTPGNTQTSPGTWTFTPVGYGSLDNFLSPDGWQSLPQILSSIGTLNGRAKTVDGAEVDEEEIFLQTVDATYPGLATPEMFNRVYTNYYISNIGNGDSLAIPLNDSVTAIKSFVFGTVWGITDSTILIDTSGGAGGGGFFSPDQTSTGNTLHDAGTNDFILTGDGVPGYTKIQRYWDDGLGGVNDNYLTIDNNFVNLVARTSGLSSGTISVSNSGGAMNSTDSTNGDYYEQVITHINPPHGQWLTRSITGTPSDGFGFSTVYYLKSTDGNLWESNTVSSEWKTANMATRTSRYKIQGVTNAGALTDWLSLSGGDLIYHISSTPSSASDTGVTGTIRWDSSYIYICTATNTWKRVAIATW